jgi:hypothetical protein
MKQRNYDVCKFCLVASALLVMVTLALLPGCKAMQPWLEPAAAATTQAINGPVGEAVKPLIPSPAREIVEAVGLVAALFLGHYRGKSVGLKSAIDTTGGAAAGA